MVFVLTSCCALYPARKTVCLERLLLFCSFNFDVFRCLGLSHSGRVGSVNFLYGVMGIANAQRALDYIRIITEFISQPEWAAVVPMFSVMDAPEQSQHIGTPSMLSL